MKDLQQQFLNSGLLDGVKTELELTQLLKQLHSTALEAMLQGELDAHLGYPKNSKSDNSNNRNGTTTKQIKTEFGKSQIAIPRDREGSFEPVVVPKHKSNSLSVENIVISLYAKGMSVSDIEDELQEIYGFKLSTSAISMITNRVNQHVLDWQNRPLESVYCVVWIFEIKRRKQSFRV